MKKLFTSKQDSQYDSFVGKQYFVGDLSLVVEEVIAEGGFSYVFLVEDHSKNKDYALKRMLVNSQSDLDNCKQEITIMKAFHRHPAIVSFKGHHTKHTGNGIYEVLLLMQHCPNGTVVDLMNQHISTGLNESLIRQIYCGIVDAICLLHSNGYLHRDIKAENILIGPNNEYVLCDFGSAYKGKMNPELQGHSIVEDNVNRFTTLSYRAPEMCDMYLGYEIGPPADVWALGVLLYKLCFFTTPFEENTLAIARAKYTLPASSSKYSANLLSVIRDTLKAKPTDRLTAKQILARLKEGNKHKKNSNMTRTQAAISTTPSPTSSLALPTQHAPSHVNRTEGATEAIKPRSRPRGKQTKESSLIRPPVINPVTTNEHNEASREHSVTPKEYSVASKESSLVSKESSLAPKESSLASKESSVASKESSLVSKESSLAPKESSVASKESSVASKESSLVSRERSVTSPDRVVGKSQNVRPKESKRNRISLHNSSQGTEDPWGSSTSCTASRILPENAIYQKTLPRNTFSQKTEKRDTVSPIVFLPPPLSSTNNKTRRARGHSRAKSDTSFFKGSSSPIYPGEQTSADGLSSSSGELTSPIKQDRNTATSSGELAGGIKQQDRSMTTSSGELTCGLKPDRSAATTVGVSTTYETTFDSSGWSSNTFDPSPALEDEFLQLSLRVQGSSQTKLDQIQSKNNKVDEIPSKNNKMERSQTFSHSPSTRPRPVVVKRAAIISQSPQ